MMAAVYRYRDADGAALYIGASSWPVDRIQQHFWSRGNTMREVACVDIKWFDSRSDAREYEVAAIKAECPPWNVASRTAAGAV